MTCAACTEDGRVGTEIFPYSIAKGFTAWLHRRCSVVAMNREWREAFVRSEANKKVAAG